MVKINDTTTIDWMDKKPHIIKGNMRYCGKSVPVKRLKEGPLFTTYKFQDDKILKIPSAQRRPVKLNSKFHPLRLTVEEIEVAAKFKLSYPVCLVRADQFEAIDPIEKNDGGFFLFEEIPNPLDLNFFGKKIEDLTENENKIIDFVVTILKLHAKENKEIVSNFFPKNVRQRDDGSLVIIKIFERNPEGSLMERTKEKINIWSCGNEEIKKIISSQLPEEFQ